MPLDQVRYQESNAELEVVGKGWIGFISDLDAWVAGADILESASSQSLSKAMLKAGIQRLDLSPLSAADVHKQDYPPLVEHHLEPAPEGVVVKKIFAIADDDGPDINSLKRLLAPLLARERLWADVQAVEFPDLFVYPPVPWGLSLAIGSRRSRQTVGSLLDAATQAFALIEVVREGRTFGPREAAQLVRGGHGELLIGQEEAAWLEAKGNGYSLDDPEAQHELAKDASSLANGSGGLILIGFRTQRRGGVDTIQRLTPMRSATVDLRRYRRTLDRLVYPPIEGLVIDRVDSSASTCSVVIEIPPQDQALKPFLVIGSLVGSGFSGNYLALYRRRGEDSVAASAAEIHSLLLAGRVALGGRPVERDSPE